MKLADCIQTADWKAEKHVPAITVPAEIKAGEFFTVQACVGKDIAHPNTLEHNIQWVQLFFKPEGSKFAIELGKTVFTAHGESDTFTNPCLCLNTKINTNGTFIALSYCNIHGLWEDSVEVKVL